MILAGVLMMAGLQIWSAWTLGRLLKYQGALVKPLIRAEQRRTLCQLLVDSGRFVSQGARDRLLADMPDGFASNLTRGQSEQDDLATIVYEASRWSAGSWRQLLANARFMLPASSDAG